MPPPRCEEEERNGLEKEWIWKQEMGEKVERREEETKQIRRAREGE